MISLVVFDIDGVLTDGMIHVDRDGNESKSYNITEIDALNDIKRMGLKIAAITGEDTPIVDIFKNKIEWDIFISGCKDKLSALKNIERSVNITRNQICYMGDGKYDIEAISYAGLGVCPKNAIQDVKNVADIVVSGYGGEHCVSELYHILKKLVMPPNNAFISTEIKRSENKKSEKPKEFFTYLQRGIEDHSKAFEQLNRSNELKEEIEKASKILLRSIQSGGAVFLCGNGGSAADSQHIATEFVSRFYHERKAINAEALTVNTSSLTAIGNDYDFDSVFIRQLEAKGKPGDVLIGISTSGISRNVIKAMEYAILNNIHTILLTGKAQRKYNDRICECVIKVPSEDTPRIQEMHIFIGHMFAEYVEDNLDKRGGDEIGTQCD